MDGNDERQRDDAQRRDVAIRTAARRVVVKLGSSILTTASGVDGDQVGRLAAEMCGLLAEGFEIIVVTSGARAAGLARLGLSRIPRRIPEQQAAAAIGQIRLMSMYERCFSDFGRHVGQVLLTAGDIGDRDRYLNARGTFDHLLRHGVVPIVNENDSVAVDELKFGDNDRLSALVAGLVDADLLVILTDVAGLYAGDPRSGDAPLIELVEDVDEHIASGVAGGAVSTVGTGGMASKLVAARTAALRGIPTVVASGREPGTLARIFQAEARVGTLFLPRTTPMRSRKHWIAHGLPLRGALELDAGALEAVTRRGGSLLPAGIVDVRGTFSRGDCVAFVDADGREWARGLAAYDAADCRRIRGQASSRIEEILGYHCADEVVHRDDLAVLADLAEAPAATSDAAPVAPSTEERR